MKSRTVTIEGFFSPEDQEKYFYIPFEVPENTEKMNISYSVDKPEGSCIDFGLIYPDGRQNGASGGRTKEIVISARYATAGYEPCEPHAGTWQIIAGVYRAGDGVKVTYTVEFQFKGNRWLKGDTHTHTCHSDGKLTPEALLALARKKRLDYLIITDHNNNRAGYSNLTAPDLTVIEGMELTAYNGHCNLWGIRTPFEEPYCAESFEEFISLAEKAKANGAVISVNHPCCSLCGWHWPLEGFPLDAAELWNGPQHIDNMKALSWWHGELLRGRRIAAVGGSDYHQDIAGITRLLAIPTTVVYAASSSPADILDALKNGRAVVTSSPKGPMLYLKCGKTITGGETAFRDGITVELRGERLKKGHLLEVFNNDTIIYSAPIKNADLNLSLPVESSGFVRAQISRQYGRIVSRVYRRIAGHLIPAEANAPLPLPPFITCFTNPIWFV